MQRTKLAAALLLSLATLAAANAQTTTLGTRLSTSADNPAVTSNAGANWKDYTRPEVYPRAVTLPLQYISTASGKKLAVLVSVPADIWGRKISGTFPVVLTQTAYRVDLGELMGLVAPSDTTLLIGGLDKFMVKRGYITVAVDAYGTGMSDGVTALLGEQEQQGYAEAVNWVTKQSWFNGSIGVAGTSYLGISSLLTAQQQHPAVKAVFAEVPMGDSYRGTVGTGGLLNAEFLSTWLPLTQMLSVLNGPAKVLYPSQASQIAKATTDHIAAIDQWYFPTIDRGLAGETGIATDDGSFWSVRSPLEKADQIKVPTFIIGANHDIFQRDEPLLYERLKHNVNSKLLLVKGAHLQSILAAVGDSTDQNGAPGTSALLLQWFDQYLMGKETGARQLPNVTQFVDGYTVGGKDRFATTTDWPHPAMNPQRWYLRGNARLSLQAPTSDETSGSIGEPAAPTVTMSKAFNGTVATAKVEIRDGSDCSVSKEQWTLGIAGLISKACFKDDTQVAKTQGALIYETEILSQDLYLNGPIQADVWMTATKTQAAVSVRVEDVSADGKAKPLTNGLQAAVFRAVDESRSRFVNGVMIQPWHAFTASSALQVVPGEPMLVPVEVFPTAALVKAGHKLRITISSSNQAQGIWSLDKQAQANGNVSTILTDPAHPSSVVLPVVPTSALN